MVHWRAGCVERCKSGSEGGSWKPAPRSIVPVERHHDDRQGAGCLPYSATGGARRMSEVYEGVVFRSNERAARRTFGSLSSGPRLRLVRLARGVFGAYRVAGRADALDQPAVERV